MFVLNKALGKLSTSHLALSRIMQFRKKFNLNVTYRNWCSVPRCFGTKKVGVMKIKTNYIPHIHFSSAGACPPGWLGVALATATRVVNQLDIGSVSKPDPSICDFYKKKKIYCLDNKGGNR